MNSYVISAYKHSATLIKGIQDSRLNPNLEQMIVGGSGAPSPAFVGVGQIRPELNLVTTEIKTALANCGGITGAALSSDAFYFQKMLEAGLRAGTLAHIKVTAATGMIIPVSINAVQGRPATLNYLVIMTSADGSASPIVIAGSQSLEAGQDVTDEVYTMGPISINGTALEGLTSWTLNFGNVPWVNTADGHVYPTEVGIRGQAPTIIARSRDVEAFETWDIAGVAQSDTDSTIILHDQLAGGVRGSSPITFSVDAGMAHFQDLGAAHPQMVEGGVLITPVYDGTDAILAVTGLT